MQEEIRVAYGKSSKRQYDKIRKYHKKSRRDLCGLHRTYISDIELGKRNVSLENIDKIAHALQVKKSELFIEVEQYEGI